MLSKYMPKYYEKSKVMKALLYACDVELSNMSEKALDLEKQLIIDTATWGLKLWEKELGIKTNTAKPLQNRRETIKAKLRGFGTCTIEMIKNTALAYTNAEIEVTEDAANYFFKIKFKGKKGIPPDIDAFKRTIEEIKPAHLAYDIEYIFTTWKDARTKTWAEARTLTWAGLRNGG